MTREILFKAKRLDNGEWVMGGSIIQFLDDGVRSFYMPQLNEKCICKHDEVTDDILEFQNTRFYKVDGDTICQYTGLTDNNANKIWENDIIRRQDLVFTSLRKKELRTKIGYVDFSCEGYGNGYWAFWWNEKSGRCNFGINSDCCEVIGNIFDNPELLGGKENG